MKKFDCEGTIYTLAEMIAANAEDDEACEWLNSAKVGESFCGFVNVKRIQ